MSIFMNIFLLHRIVSLCNLLGQGTSILMVNFLETLIEEDPQQKSVHALGVWASSTVLHVP